MRILVVTPFLVERLALGFLLAAEGHVVTTAANDVEGRDRVEAELPDVVLAHVALIERDGRAWLDVLRARRVHARLVLLSPRAGEVEDPRAICMTKPIDPAQLGCVLATMGSAPS